MSETAKTHLMYAAMILVAGILVLYPDIVFAQSGSGGIVRGKLDQARNSYAVPIGIGIAAVGATCAIVAWLFDMMDWKGMAKWIFGAMLIGVVGGIIVEMAA